MTTPDRLQTARWSELRVAAVERAAGKCEGCGRRTPDLALRLDNRSAPIGEEVLGDVRALCGQCIFTPRPQARPLVFRRAQPKP